MIMKSREMERYLYTINMIMKCGCERAENFKDKSSNSRDIATPAKGGLEPGVDVGPGALVLMLLLGPAELGVGVLGDFLLDQVIGEGRNLKDTDKSGIPRRAYPVATNYNVGSKTVRNLTPNENKLTCKCARSFITFRHYEI